jgi:hypothetical protein
MTITYTGVSLATYNQVQFVMTGDGTGTVLVLNLSKPPFNISFGGVLPSSALVNTRSPSISATAVLSLSGADVVLTITFSAAPPAGITMGPDITFIYNTL